MISADTSYHTHRHHARHTLAKSTREHPVNAFDNTRAPQITSRNENYKLVPRHLHVVNLNHRT